jgi:hypothetical protein
MKPEGKRPLERARLYLMLILKWILWKEGVRGWTGLG